MKGGDPQPSGRSPVPAAAALAVTRRPPAQTSPPPSPERTTPRRQLPERLPRPTSVQLTAVPLSSQLPHSVGAHTAPSPGACVPPGCPHSVLLSPLPFHTQHVELALGLTTPL